MNGDFVDCISNKNNTATCLRNWKLSLVDSDCRDENLEKIYQQFCEIYNNLTWRKYEKTK